MTVFNHRAIKPWKLISIERIIFGGLSAFMKSSHNRKTIFIFIAWRRRRSITKKTSDALFFVWFGRFRRKHFFVFRRKWRALKHSDPSLSQNNRINVSVFLRGEKIMLSPETWFHGAKNAEVDQELINGNRWRHIVKCTRHQSDHSPDSHDEIEISSRR